MKNRTAGEIVPSSVFLSYIIFVGCVTANIRNKAVDIGYTCKYDSECYAGNGGKYSVCSKITSICTCSITRLGERICEDKMKEYEYECKRKAIFDVTKQCHVKCTLTGAKKRTENEDWYGSIIEPFANMLPDKKTAVCFDPERALHSLPDGFVIKPSSIPNAGLGVFTEAYIEQGTVFGPYKGIVGPDIYSDVFYEYSWSVAPDQIRTEYMWIHGGNTSTSNWLRYVNTPTSASMENIVSVQYRGEIFYHAFKSIYPGTELLVWYGGDYDEYLGIEKYDRPTYFFAEPGYAGGECKKAEEGQACVHDNNTICADSTCFCVPGTHKRAAMCTKSNNEID